MQNQLTMKKVVFISVVLLMCMVTYAQPYSSVLLNASYDFPAANDQTIVRVAGDGTHAVVHVRDGNTPYFYCVNYEADPMARIYGWTPCYKITLDTTWIIHDFRTFGDHVAFCGEVNGQGLYGWFLANNLISGSSSVHIHTFTVPAVERFKMMVLGLKEPFREGPWIALAAEKYDAIIHNIREYLFQFDGVFFTSTNYYRMRKLWTSSTDREQVQDLLLENNRFCMIAKDPRFPYSPFTVRCMDSWYMDTQHELDTIYRYNIGLGESSGRVRGIAMDGTDHFAVAYISGSLKLKVRCVKLFSLNITTSQQIHMEKEDYRLELSYSDFDDETLAVLQHVNNPNKADTFHLFKPFIRFPYAMKQLFHDERKKFTSLDLLHDNFFVSTGNYWAYSQMLPNGDSHKCPSLTKREVEIIDEYESNIDTDYQGYDYGSVPGQLHIIYPDPILPKKSCSFGAITE